MLDDLYQDIILEHNAHPKHYGRLKKTTHTAKGYNPVCGDIIIVDINRNDEGRVVAIGFESNGCAISKSAASIMTESVSQKNSDEIGRIAERFIQITTGTGSLAHKSYIESFQALSGVRNYPSRIKCANLPWVTLKAALSGDEIITTE